MARSRKKVEQFCTPCTDDHPKNSSGNFESRSLVLWKKKNDKYCLTVLTSLVNFQVKQRSQRPSMSSQYSHKLRYWQTRTHCCGHIVAHDVSWAAQTGKHLLRTQNVSEQNQKLFLCPGHKICVRNKCCARGQTEKHLCRQQCVLVCQGL